MCSPLAPLLLKHCLNRCPNHAMQHCPLSFEQHWYCRRFVQKRPNHRKNPIGHRPIVSWVQQRRAFSCCVWNDGFPPIPSLFRPVPVAVVVAVAVVFSSCSFLFSATLSIVSIWCVRQMGWLCRVIRTLDLRHLCPGLLFVRLSLFWWVSCLGWCSRTF